MIARFPHRYRVQLASENAERGVLSSPGRPEIVGGAPSEFGGRDDWWSPEQLLIAATSLCLMSTIQAFAAREKLSIRRLRCSAEGTVDKTPTGLAFTAIQAQVDVTVDPEDVSRATAILDRAKRSCLVSNSLKCPVTVESDVSAR
jgi:organic hydroperoxide reductase OsmC/OhrA